MMRAIKFRAWITPEDKDDGEPFMDVIDGFSIGDCIYTSDGSEWFWREGQLMQFTGLHDRNGKPIFDGDIIKGLKGTIFEVKFLNGAFVLHEGDLEWFFEQDDTEGRFFLHNLEVIGNKWEHPHLLKEAPK